MWMYFLNSISLEQKLSPVHRHGIKYIRNNISCGFLHAKNKHKIKFHEDKIHIYLITVIFPATNIMADLGSELNIYFLKR